MIIFGVDGRLDRLARFYANNNGNMDCLYGCSDREPDTEIVELTLVGE
jgi:hypothetical protein